MGVLIKGVWSNIPTNEKTKSGQFVRKESFFRNWITNDSSKVIKDNNSFVAEKKRYVLYVSYACPWAHRAIIYRAILGLEQTIEMCVVNPVYNAEGWSQQGWSFAKYPDVEGDYINNKKYLHEIYSLADPNYSGKVTVPVLWDKKYETIVSNESSDIIKMFYQSFKQFSSHWLELYPNNLHKKIDELNEYIYFNINNGVYRTGFAASQKAYEEGIIKIFSALEKIDNLLKDNKYLFGDKPLETDWRLFTTLIRFDAVYYYHFKCNIKKLIDFKNIIKYLQKLYKYPKINETIKLNHIIDHYYLSHLKINPNGIIPYGSPKNINQIINI